MQRIRPLLLQCPQCKKEFARRTSKQKFCSRHCARHYTLFRKQKIQVETSCDHCGKKFFTYPKYLDKGRGKYCSRQCQGLARRVHPVNTETGICPHCKLERPVTDFKKRKNGARNGWCLTCRRDENCRKARTLYGRWLYGRLAAKKRGIPWDIDFETYQKILSTTECHYCGGPLERSGSGLDRTDNSGAYLEVNVVPCCDLCNTIKNDRLTYAEMIMLSPTLRILQQARSAISPR